MSEEKFVYTAIGVFKVDYTIAGYAQLRELAEDWAKRDENFYELTVRNVSERNYGIQFVYIAKNVARDFRIIRQYKAELEEKIGEIYAVDYNQSIGNKAQEVVVLKGFEN